MRVNNATVKGHTAAKLFGLSGIHLPNYQRPTSWKSNKIFALYESVIDYLSQPDINVEKGLTGYKMFLGNIMLDSGDGSENGVVDGQQRINALTVIAAAIRDVLISVGKTKSAFEIHRCFFITKSGNIRYTPHERLNEVFQLLRTPRTGVSLGTISQVIPENEDDVYKVTLNTEWDVNAEDTLVCGDQPAVNVSTQAFLKAKENQNLILRFGEGHRPEIGQDVILEGRGWEPKTLHKHQMMQAYWSIGSHFRRFFTSEHVVSKQNKLTWNTTCRYLKVSCTWPGLASEEKVVISRPGYENIEAFVSDWNINFDADNGHCFESIRVKLCQIGDDPTEISLPQNSRIILRDYEDSERPASEEAGTTEDQLATRIAGVLVNGILFSVTKFDKRVDAVSHFILANDGNRMAPLYNIDLLHAEIYKFKEALEGSEGADAEAVTKVMDTWMRIRDRCYWNHWEDDLEKAPKAFDDFLGRYLLGIEGEHHTWTKQASNSMFPVIEKNIVPDVEQITSTLNYVTRLERAAIMHDLMKKTPGKYGQIPNEITERFSNSIVACIEILSTWKLIIPVIMSLNECVHSRGWGKTQNDERVLPFLKFMIRWLIWNWTLPRAKNASTGDGERVDQLTEQQFYQLVPQLVSHLLSDSENPLDECEQFLKQEMISELNHESFTDSVKVELAYTPELCRPILLSMEYSKQTPENHQLLYLTPETGRSKRIESEHIMPKDSKCIDKDWWYIDRERHLHLRNSLGNFTALEYYINSAVKDAGWLRKNSYVKDGAERHYGKSVMQSTIELHGKYPRLMKWREVNIEERSRQSHDYLLQNYPHPCSLDE